MTFLHEGGSHTVAITPFLDRCQAYVRLGERQLSPKLLGNVRLVYQPDVPTAKLVVTACFNREWDLVPYGLHEDGIWYYQGSLKVVSSALTVLGNRLVRLKEPLGNCLLGVRRNPLVSLDEDDEKEYVMTLAELGAVSENPKGLFVTRFLFYLLWCLEHRGIKTEAVASLLRIP